MNSSEWRLRQNSVTQLVDGRTYSIILFLQATLFAEGNSNECSDIDVMLWPFVGNHGRAAFWLATHYWVKSGSVISMLLPLLPLLLLVVIFVIIIYHCHYYYYYIINVKVITILIIIIFSLQLVMEYWIFCFSVQLHSHLINYVIIKSRLAPYILIFVMR